MKRQKGARPGDQITPSTAVHPAPDRLVRPLTAKEKRVLEFIEGAIHEAGISPSYQEIREHFGFASLNSVQRYIKQLQTKGYIYVPGDNQKRAITLIRSSNAIQNSLQSGALSSAPGIALKHPHKPLSHGENHQPQNSLSSAMLTKTPPSSSTERAESFSLPLLGRVAAGQPIEAFEHDEFVDVPSTFLRHPEQSFALKVEGQSMVEDGIFDGDIVFVQRQDHANKGDTVVAVVDGEATVKRFFLHSARPLEPQRAPTETPLVELRPANSQMKSMWFEPEQVKIQGLVVGLMRKF